MTPKRLKENEAFMWRLADRQLDEFLAQGRCEFIRDYAQPFALLVIADLLGVPQEDHELFRTLLQTESRTPGQVEDTRQVRRPINPLAFLAERFTSYVEDRRREPRADVLTGLATATFPDGSTPEVADVVAIASFLFAAGQETTARLLASALQVTAERPDLQQLLRDERDRIPNFIEETLRMESPVKSDFRLARTTATIGGVEIPAGCAVMVMPGAVNRDPARFERPDEFRIDRGNVREHIAFGRGIHTCPGGPLARVEARVSIERLLDRMADIRISEAEHGPAAARRYEYEPTYILRGLRALHLEYTPIA
jgi:cytochrome P450